MYILQTRWKYRHKQTVDSTYRQQPTADSQLGQWQNAFVVAIIRYFLVKTGHAVLQLLPRLQRQFMMLTTVFIEIALNLLSESDTVWQHDLLFNKECKVKWSTGMEMCPVQLELKRLLIIHWEFNWSGNESLMTLWLKDMEMSCSLFCCCCLLLVFSINNDKRNPHYSPGLI